MNIFGTRRLVLAITFSMLAASNSAAQEGEAPTEKPLVENMAGQEARDDAASVADSIVADDQPKGKRRRPGRMGAVNELIENVQEARVGGVEWRVLLFVGLYVAGYMAAALFVLWLAKKLLLLGLAALEWKCHDSQKLVIWTPPKRVFELVAADRRAIYAIIASLGVVAFLIGLALLMAELY
jgi:hypothetical protein